MKRFLLASVALAVLASTPAAAADLSVRAPLDRAPVALYPVTWTGCFLGGRVGGLWARKQWTDRTPGDPLFGASYGSHDVDSWAAGFQGGCDYQFGAWVVGIQADYAFTDGKGSNGNAVLIGLTDRS